MPIEIKMSDRFPFGLPAAQRMRQGLNSQEYVYEYERLGLSVEVDGNNDVRIWQRVFNNIAAAQGGRIFFDVYGESVVRPLSRRERQLIHEPIEEDESIEEDELISESITIPRQRNLFITFEGLDKTLCSIRGDSFYWEKKIRDDQNFCQQVKLFRDKFKGKFPGLETFIQELPERRIRIPMPVFWWSNAENIPIERFIWRNMTIRHTYSGTVISHAKNPRFRDLSFSENKQELRECTFSNLRLNAQRGDPLIPFVRLDDEFNFLEDCEESEDFEPIGLNFINSSYCTVIGCLLIAQGTTEKKGHALKFDENSKYNTVISSRIIELGQGRWRGEEGLDEGEQVLDDGTNNNWLTVTRNGDDSGTFFLDRRTVWTEELSSDL